MTKPDASDIAGPAVPAPDARLPLVLVPGMMCDERLFGPQADTIGRERPVQVVQIDRDDVDAMAAQVLAAAPRRFALAGLSLGGIVAMAVMAAAPERVACLALLDTNPLSEQPDVAARREPQIDAVRRGGLADIMSRQMIPHYSAGAPTPADPTIAALCLDMALRLGPETFIRQSRALQRRPDRSAALRGITAPTLILCGSNDRLCPPHRHVLMHGLIANSELQIVHGAGHLPTLQSPEATTRLLRTWLAMAETSRADETGGGGGHPA